MTRKSAAATCALILSLVAHGVAAPPKGGERKSEPNKPKSEGNRSEPNKPKSEPNKSRNEPGKPNTEANRGKSSPGGNWSEPTHNNAARNAGQAGNAERKVPNSKENGAPDAAAGAAAAKRNQPQNSGAKDAAAGAAAANRNAPKATGAQGAAAGAAAANRNAPKATGAEGAAAGAAAANRRNPNAAEAEGAAAVRNSYRNPNLYNEHWYAANPGAWAIPGAATAAAWSAADWGAISGHLGVTSQPVVYNYGSNVTYADGNVAMNGQTLGSAEDFSQQAATIAQSGQTAETTDSDEWLPLGVYAMVRNEQQHPQLILQLAINKQGILRGNYTDELTEHTQPIRGAVDPKTQRAAWIVGDNSQSVMEAGINNLSQEEAPALIHKRGNTDHWLLVRLNQPDQDSGDANAAGDAGDGAADASQSQ